MKLSAIYNATINKNERSRIRKEMYDTFGVSVSTIFNWLSGRTIPPKRYHSAIAEIMGISVAELFPATENHSA